MIFLTGYQDDQHHQISPGSPLAAFFPCTLPQKPATATDTSDHWAISALPAPCRAARRGRPRRLRTPRRPGEEFLRTWRVFLVLGSFSGRQKSWGWRFRAFLGCFFFFGGGWCRGKPETRGNRPSCWVSPRIHFDTYLFECGLFSCSRTQEATTARWSPCPCLFLFTYIYIILYTYIYISIGKKSAPCQGRLKLLHFAGFSRLLGGWCPFNPPFRWQF